MRGCGNVAELDLLREEWPQVAPMIRARSAPAARLAVHPILAFHDIADAIPEVVDAAEVTAEASRWVVDIVSAGEVVAPGIAVHRARYAGWFWLGRCSWLRLGFGSGSRLRLGLWGCGRLRGRR